jgi:hypothetical protein
VSTESEAARNRAVKRLFFYRRGISASKWVSCIPADEKKHCASKSHAWPRGRGKSSRDRYLSNKKEEGETLKALYFDYFSIF